MKLLSPFAQRKGTRSEANAGVCPGRKGGRVAPAPRDNCKTHVIPAKAGIQRGRRRENLHPIGQGYGADEATRAISAA